MEPSWSREIKDLYLSGAANQFVLHGNVHDRMVLPVREPGEEPSLGSLYDFLAGHQLRKFDLLFTYDLGHGLRIDAPTAPGRQALEAWPSTPGDRSLPRLPREAMALIDHFLRYAANLGRLEGGAAAARLNIGVIVQDASLVLPSRAAAPGASHEIHSAASLVRSWSVETPFLEQNLAVFLVTDNLNDLHPLIPGNPRVATVAVPLPGSQELETAFRRLAARHPNALAPFLDGGGLGRLASRLAGTRLGSVEALVKEHDHRQVPLTEASLSALKKQLVERDCRDLIEFVEPGRDLNGFHGSEAVKNWLRQDIALWRQDDFAALPMGYLVCGPVGTGKTFLVECLAGEAGLPVVKFKHFRDRWVGSTEGNLERMFTFLHALDRCLVFIDEADQALGSRMAGTGDSGLSGRVYAMIAKEMGNTRNRGKILWVLASSRPDLIEVDLKRPGRIDVRIPLFPSVDAAESYALLHAQCRRLGLELPSSAQPEWAAFVPARLTPGAAEMVAVKIYRLTRTRNLPPEEALALVLRDYHDPVPPDVMDFQIRLAVRESSDPAFVPAAFRGA